MRPPDGQSRRAFRADNTFPAAPRWPLWGSVRLAGNTPGTESYRSILDSLVFSSLAR